MAFFAVPTHLISICYDFQLEKCLKRPQTRANLFICFLDHAYEALLIFTHFQNLNISGKNSKQNFSSHAVSLFMFQNGLDRKDAIFVMVLL